LTVALQPTRRNIYDAAALARLQFSQKTENMIEVCIGPPQFTTRESVIRRALQVRYDEEPDSTLPGLADPFRALSVLIDSELRHYDHDTGTLMRQTAPDTHASEKQAQITVTVPSDAMLNIEGLARKAHVTNGDIIKRALAAYTKQSSEPTKGIKATGAINNRAQLVKTSRLIIVALEETLDYDPARHHNQPPPDLWVDDSEYLEELRKLVAELKVLNGHLEAAKLSKAKTQQSATRLAKHFDAFLRNYAESFGKAAGKGSGYLAVAAIAGVLYQTGVLPELLGKILSRIPSH
jgi:hypothetical protein